jgi:hypothetical protein
VDSEGDETSISDKNNQGAKEDMQKQINVIKGICIKS